MIALCMQLTRFRWVYIIYTMYYNWGDLCRMYIIKSKWPIPICTWIVNPEISFMIALVSFIQLLKKDLYLLWYLLYRSQKINSIYLLGAMSCQKQKTAFVLSHSSSQQPLSSPYLLRKYRLDWNIKWNGTKNPCLTHYTTDPWHVSAHRHPLSSYRSEYR